MADQPGVWARRSCRWFVFTGLGLTLLGGAPTHAQESTAPYPTGLKQERAVNVFPRSVLAPVVGPNVLTNSREICPDGRGLTQSETTLAISGNAVVVAYNDFRGFFCPDQGYQVTGWAYSLDFGKTFTDGGPLPGRTSLRGDPWLATGPDGTIYLASLWQGLSGLAVLRGTVTDAGISWSDPTVITTGGAFDKEALAVDPNSGTIYMTYTRFGGPGGIWLLRSTDGGVSFEPAVPVGSGGGVQGSFPAVGPNGELYVVWNIGWPAQTGIGFARSLDGGQTFSAPQTVGQICNFQIPGLNRPNPAFPQMAVDTSGGPHHGNLYTVWHTACPRGNGDAVMIRSADGGETWSAPTVINDDVTDAIQFYPTISVDEGGRVNAFFYDRRERPGTTVTDLFFAQSNDGGEMFGENIKTTEVPSEWVLGSEGSPNYGDYINSTTLGGTAFVAYAESRDGDPDTYFTWVSPVQK